MNPTNLSCPSDIARFVTTDYRPSKALYENVNNNYNFRLYMQRNAKNIRDKNLQNFVREMNCSCETGQCCGIKQFDSSKIDAIERR